jgi:nucleotide-binding universal stress UspA family protein
MNTTTDIAFEPTESSPLIVATDGREQSDGAVRAGALLARNGDAWRVITVASSFSIASPELDLQVAAEAVAALRDTQLRSVKEQVNKIVGERASVAVEVRDGRPADVIASAAAEANASLIVAGLGRHNVIDRVLGDETALQLVRAANTPVLAVASDFTPPRATIVGLDFSENSVHAAQLALRFVGRGATVFILNVAPQDSILSAVTGGRAAYEEHSLAALAHLAERLEVPPGVHVQPVVRQGDPGTRILEYATETRAGMIAIGTRGQGFVSRMLVGSVATKVIRGSSVAVLTLPR